MGGSMEFLIAQMLGLVYLREDDDDRGGSYYIFDIHGTRLYFSVHSYRNSDEAKRAAAVYILDKIGERVAGNLAIEKYHY